MGDQYRKKPVVIEAFQMTLERRWDNSEWPTWLNMAWNANKGEGAMWPNPDKPNAEGQKSPAELVIGTLEGGHIVEFGDFIIQGVKGELYPCKPDIFEATYDAVEEDEDDGVNKLLAQNKAAQKHASVYFPGKSVTGITSVKSGIRLSFADGTKGLVAGAEATAIMDAEEV